MYAIRSYYELPIATAEVFTGLQRHPDGEHAKLVDWLVNRVTGAFRGYWARS